MGIPNILNTGNSGLIAARAGIATTGHNISNANTEGFSRQRVITETADVRAGQAGAHVFGTGTRIARVERINDEYVEKQVRNAQREMSHHEEKDMILRQVEDVFNEMGGDGLNRLVSKFFNEFRKLSNEPENPALRHSVREASRAMVNDFHRLRKEMENICNHIDQKVSGYVKEVNTLSSEITQLNNDIRTLESSRGSPNDLLDKRDLKLKQLASLLDVTMHKDNLDNFNVDMKNIGPLLAAGSEPEKLSVLRTPADGRGKPEGALDIKSTGYVNGTITHILQGGKLGALLDLRDKLVSSVYDRVDELAFNLTSAVNAIHQQGYTAEGETGIQFFKPLASKDRAAEFIGLSDQVEKNTNNMATALIPDSPGDNRIAIAISELQGAKVMGDGNSTFDEWYDSIVSDVGVETAQNRFALNQQRDIMTQLNKIREQISGVSIDEETANLMQFQHVFDASAKVIQVADDILKTVLSLKRD